MFLKYFSEAVWLSVAKCVLPPLAGWHHCGPATSGLYGLWAVARMTSLWHHCGPATGGLCGLWAVARMTSLWRHCGPATSGLWPIESDITMAATWESPGACWNDCPHKGIQCWLFVDKKPFFVFCQKRNILTFTKGFFSLIFHLHQLDYYITMTSLWSCQQWPVACVAWWPVGCGLWAVAGHLPQPDLASPPTTGLNNTNPLRECNIDKQYPGDAKLNAMSKSMWVLV